MRAFYFLLSLTVLFLSSCTQESLTYTSDAVSDYVPLKVGNYITYRVDSTVFPNFGRTVETHSYQEKQVVDAQIPDASGRPSYRIIRYVRDVAGTQGWQTDGTYLVTPLAQTIEVSENNLRFVRLALPVTEGFSWKPYEYLPNNPYSNYNSAIDNQLVVRTFKYTSVNGSTTLNGKSYSSVITVETSRDSLNAGNGTTVTNPNGLANKLYETEQYAKGVGMIYQEYTLWDYQPPNGSTGYYNGFAVRRSILDHN